MPATQEYFKQKFLQAFDMVIECLTDRFDQDQLEKYADLQDLLMLAANMKSFNDKLNKVVEFYNRDLDKDRLKYQLETFSTMFDQKENLVFNDIIAYFKNLGPGQKSLLSEVCKVVKLVLVLPASTASAERSFSKMKLIKTYLRSTMSQKRLNHCMILGVYPELVDDLDSTEIVEEFAKKMQNINMVLEKQIHSM